MQLRREQGAAVAGVPVGGWQRCALAKYLLVSQPHPHQSPPPPPPPPPLIAHLSRSPAPLAAHPDRPPVLSPPHAHTPLLPPPPSNHCRVVSRHDAEANVIERIRTMRRLKSSQVRAGRDQGGAPSGVISSPSDAELFRELQCVLGRPLLFDNLVVMYPSRRCVSWLSYTFPSLFLPSPPFCIPPCLIPARANFASGPDASTRAASAACKLRGTNGLVCSMSCSAPCDRTPCSGLKPHNVHPPRVSCVVYSQPLLFEPATPLGPRRPLPGVVAPC
jgi:hypothetical protein